MTLFLNRQYDRTLGGGQLGRPARLRGRDPVPRGDATGRAGAAARLVKASLLSSECIGAPSERAPVPTLTVVINPIDTLENQPLNMIGNLVQNG